MWWGNNIHLDWIWSWADIKRNCNTFFGGKVCNWHKMHPKWPKFYNLYQVWFSFEQFPDFQRFGFCNSHTIWHPVPGQFWNGDWVSLSNLFMTHQTVTKDKSNRRIKESLIQIVDIWYFIAKECRNVVQVWSMGWNAMKHGAGFPILENKCLLP